MTGLQNALFESRDKVEERLCKVIRALTNETAIHITRRERLRKLFFIDRSIELEAVFKGGARRF